MKIDKQAVQKTMPVVALVGRVNVGKSTLFNRLIEQKKALVSNIAGTTRTRNEGVSLWRGEEIKIVDTGGLTFDLSIPLEKEVIEQSNKAIEEADIIVLVTDGQEGLLPQEKDLARQIIKLKAKKSVILVANKIDNTRIETALTANKDWLRLGLGEPFPISANSGRNVGNFLDKIFEIITDKKLIRKIVQEDEEEIINVSVIGKPNVGKSSLFNKIIGEEKVIVSSMPHTTREPFDTLTIYKAGDKTYKINFIDTAGIRRKTKVSGFLERSGISKSLEAIEKSDIILFVIDGSETISSQDMQLGGLLEKKSKSVILLVNKWDMAQENSDAHRNKVKKMVYGYFPHVDFAPILFVSGLTGYKTNTVFPEIIKVWNARHTSIPDGALKIFINNVVKIHLPSRGKGSRQPKVMGFTQLASNPPIFEILIKYRTSMHRSYLNFIENKLREQFDFTGTPIVIKFKKTKI